MTNEYAAFCAIWILLALVLAFWIAKTPKSDDTIMEWALGFRKHFDFRINKLEETITRISRQLERIEHDMVKQADLDAVAEALRVQGQTLNKVYGEVVALKQQNPQLDLTSINAAINENNQALASIDGLNDDFTPDPIETVDAGTGTDTLTGGEGQDQSGQLEGQE
jgi:hypothetical protein